MNEQGLAKAFAMSDALHRRLGSGDKWVEFCSLMDMCG